MPGGADDHASGCIAGPQCWLRLSPTGRCPGEVVDDTGKPLADVAVVYYAASFVSGQRRSGRSPDPTDAGGQFRMKIPAHRRTEIVNGVNFLAYRPGLAITASRISGHRLCLAKAGAANRPD